MPLGPRSYEVSKNTWLLPSRRPSFFCTSNQSSFTFVSTSNITLSSSIIYSLHKGLLTALCLLYSYVPPNSPQIVNWIYLRHKSDHNPMVSSKSFSSPLLPAGYNLYACRHDLFFLTCLGLMLWVSWHTTIYICILSASFSFSMLLLWHIIQYRTYSIQLYFSSFS